MNIFFFVKKKPLSLCSITHDGSHGAISKRPLFNRLGLYFGCFALWDDWIWMQHHVYGHHSYTGFLPLSLAPSVASFSLFRSRTSTFPPGVNRKDPDMNNARAFLRNVSARLRPGGVFVGTTTDANVLVRRLREAPALEFGNVHYNVRFGAAHAAKKFPADAPFGISYRFSLTESVEDCEEYLVHFPTLRRLAEEHVPRLLEQVAVAHSLPPPQRAHGAGVGAVARAVRLALELRGQSDVEAARSLAYARARHREQRVCIES